MAVTLKNPVVVNDDGTVDILVAQGRTFKFSVTNLSLLNPLGYKARFALKSSYTQADDDVVASADSEDGSIVISQIPDNGGSLFAITITDEEMEVAVTKGKWDMVIESAGGEETTIAAGSWTLWKRVTP